MKSLKSHSNAQQKLQTAANIIPKIKNYNNIFMQLQFDLIPASDEECPVPARAR
jgi:hypothetical protein